MTPDIFKQSKNLFLIFPPGCGGNHVANLLSMNPDFESRYTHDNYYEDMKNKYQKLFGYGPEADIGGPAHFSDLQNLQMKQLIKFESKIVNSKKPYIFCSHAVEYIIENSQKNLNPYKQRIFCLFSKPTGSNKLVNDRMRNGVWYNGEQDEMHYMGTPVHLLYKKEIFASKANINSDNIFTIDTDLYYSIEGYDYLHETIKTNLGIELSEVCRQLHTQYIKYTQLLFGKG